MSRGACRDADPELFFLDPEDNASFLAEKAAQAKKICDSCPVMTECLLWGLLEQPGDKWSIFGGTTYWQRRQIRRKIGWAASRPALPVQARADGTRPAPLTDPRR
jgi:WhiB family transcriptional regulator, redox-sensing transcriptional regulator